MTSLITYEQMNYIHLTANTPNLPAVRDQLANTSINSFTGRKFYIRSHPKQESNSKQQELRTRPQSPATSSLQSIQPPLPTTCESPRFTQDFTNFNVLFVPQKELQIFMKSTYQIR